MGDGDAFEVEVFYPYGYRGRDLIAIRSPVAVSSHAELVGQSVRLGADARRIVAVWRQISGPIQKGEPIGVELDAPLREIGHGGE